MLRMSAIVVAAGLLGLLAGTASAYDDTRGLVTDVRWYAAAGFITMDREVTNTLRGVTCRSRYAWVDGERPGAEYLFRLGTAALLSGKQVTVRISGCHEGNPIVQAVILHR